MTTSAVLCMHNSNIKRDKLKSAYCSNLLSAFVNCRDGINETCEVGKLKIDILIGECHEFMKHVNNNEVFFTVDEKYTSTSTKVIEVVPLKFIPQTKPTDQTKFTKTPEGIVLCKEFKI